jgi:inorganic pyrophosphatase
MIEIPKGDGRRIHLDYSRTYFIDLGPIKKAIPINDGIMPIAYGFVIGTKGKEAGENDELDALLYSKKSFNVGDRTRASPIAVLNLENNDHKVVFADDSAIKNWRDLPQNDRNLLLKYFGYKSPINRIEDKMEALRLIQECVTDKPLPIPKGVRIVKEKSKEKR